MKDSEEQGLLTQRDCENRIKHTEVVGERKIEINPQFHAAS